VPFGKLGLQAPIPNKPALQLRSVLHTSGGVPAHPASADHLATLAGGWQVLGNNDFGDCAAVTWANARRLVTATLGDRETYPDLAQVVDLYRTQNPGFDPAGTQDTNGPGSEHDQGMVFQTLLEHLVSVGGPDGVKAVAFAQVDFTDEAELDAAISIFGGVWFGIDVLAANETAFDRGQPWDYVRGSQDLGGHAVLGGGYSTNPDFITWARECQLTDAFRTHLMQEAWVVIWPEHLGSKAFQAGVDVHALADAYRELTGRILDVPTAPVSPTPTPAPVPAPAPEPEPGSNAFPAEAYEAWRAHPRSLSKTAAMRDAIDTWLGRTA